MCALLFRSRKTEKKERSVGHFDNEPKITEEKILVSTRTSEGTAIEYLTCNRRVAKRVTTGFDVCLSVIPSTVKQPVSQWIDSVAYPGILFGGVQQIQLRTEDRENGDLGEIAP